MKSYESLGANVYAQWSYLSGVTLFKEKCVDIALRNTMKLFLGASRQTTILRNVEEKCRPVRRPEAAIFFCSIQAGTPICEYEA